MPTIAERKAALLARIAAKEKRLEEVKIVKRLTASKQADQKALEKIQVEEARKMANAKRKASNNCKIVLGAGLQKCQEPIRSRMVVTVLSALEDKDRERVKPWVVLRDVDLSALPLTVEPVVISPAPETPPKAADPASVATPKAESTSAAPEPPAKADPTAAAVMRTLEAFDWGGLTIIEGEFLKAAKGEDRGHLEVLFARLTKAATAGLPDMVELDGNGQKVEKSKEG